MGVSFKLAEVFFPLFSENHIFPEHQLLRVRQPFLSTVAISLDNLTGLSMTFLVSDEECSLFFLIETNFSEV